MTKENIARAGITKIALTGFQVFIKRTELPIGKINLLYGPNSAGKSAIEDAFSIVNMLKTCNTLNGVKTKNQQRWSDSHLHYGTIANRISQENNEFFLKLKSCWNKSGSPAAYWPWMEIEIESCYSMEEYEGIVIDAYGNGDHIQCKSINEKFRFYFDSADQENNLDSLEFSLDKVNFSYALDIDNKGLLGFNEGNGSFAMNCKHPTIHLPDFSSFFGHDKDISDVTAFLEKIDLLKNNDFLMNKNLFKDINLQEIELVSFNKNVIKFNVIYGFSFLGYCSDDSSPVMIGPAPFDLIKNKVEYKRAFEIFSKHFQKILSDVNLYRLTIPKFAFVSASRQIPLKDDLLIYDKSSYEDNFLIESQLTGFVSYLDLGRNNIYSKNSYIPYLENDKIIEKINYFLDTHLFKEKGYFIGKDLEFVSSKNSPHTKSGEIQLTFTQFYLADPDGTRFGFDEVGSGLGYVFPVLCVLAQDKKQLIIVQQPELHLHPALQAALGDVLIESAESKTLMIETHSEHLLLRILKRIRQTHLQASIAPELQINADDVCVLYFNPLPDGTTTVKRLRITEDGEFMDRWPRGFFGERDQELLDE